MCMAAPVRSVIRSGPAAPVCLSRFWRRWRSTIYDGAWRRCALAGGKPSPLPWSGQPEGNSMLTEEQEMIRSMVRDFAQGIVLPGAEKRDREALFPAAELKAMGELGLLGMLVPEEWGGSAAGYLSF